MILKPTYEELKQRNKKLESRLEQIEETLRVSVERNRLATSASKVGVWDWNIKTDDFYLDPNVKAILGYTDEEIPNDIEEWVKYVHPEDSGSVMEAAQACLDGKTPEYAFEHRMLHKDGSIRWILVRGKAIRDESGNAIRLIGTDADITYRKQMEQAHLENEKKYRNLFENGSDLLCIHDLEGNLVETNLTYKEQYGLSSTDLRGKNIRNFLPERYKSEFDNYLRRIIRNGEDEGYLRAIDKFGNEVLLEYRNKLIRDKDDKPIAVQGSARDITERFKAEKEKLQAQEIVVEHEKFALVGRIAGKMAHDFNKVLAGILGNAELALFECTNTKTRKTLELISELSHRGKNLTKNLVTFAKGQELKQEYFPINDKIDFVLNLLKKDLKGIEVIKECSSRLPDLLADPGMIEHGLVNMIQNSIHATSKTDHPTIIIRTYQYNERIGIEVEDNGCGIPEKFILRIYEPAFTLKGSRDVSGFYKSDIKGTGYGMSNVKKYVEQHKGSISIDSEVGKGTKITIRLPVIKKELSEKEKSEILEQDFCNEKYILLVEDEPAIADVQYRILTHEPFNHRVDIATNGQIAIDLFDRNEYDFVSLDYALPGEISGIDVYNHMREINKTIPILFISGNLEFLESIKELKQKDTCIDHLSKPCQNKEYIGCINKLLDFQSGRGARYF